MRSTKYLVIVEENDTGVGANLPDLSASAVAAQTRDKVVVLIQEAIEIPIEGLRKAGDPIPAQSASSLNHKAPIHSVRDISPVAEPPALC